VWAGASAPSGSPTATLSVPGAQSSDSLGFLGDEGAGQAVQLADVTGDGVLDIGAGAAWARVGGTARGAIYVFPGGSGLVGATGPSATLSVPGQNGGHLGSISGGQGIQVADVTGDGVLDVLAGRERSTQGAIYVFAGGASLTGAVSPSATLTATGATHGD